VTYGELAEMIVHALDRAPKPWLITIGGSVASGKTTLAGLLRTALEDRIRVDVVSTDGFLFPNAVLESRGLMQRKGFPESYDRERLVRFVRDFKSGLGPLTAPLYSHLQYDVVAEVQFVDRPELVILEGLVTETVRDLADVSIYIDAPEEELRRWFLDRFRGLRETAFLDPQSFFHALAAMPEEEALALATGAWETINLANLREHIAPTRELASLVVVKGAGHVVERIVRRR